MLVRLLLRSGSASSGSNHSFADTPGVFPQPNGYAVSRSADYIVYSVEAEYIDRVVAQYGPCESITHSIPQIKTLQ